MCHVMTASDSILTLDKKKSKKQNNKKTNTLHAVMGMLVFEPISFCYIFFTEFKNVSLIKLFSLSISIASQTNKIPLLLFTLVMT